MKINLFVGLSFSFLLVIILSQSCKKDVNPNSGRTAIEYAYECESVLGPLPKFSCSEAIEVPSTKDGIPQTYPITGEGNGSTNPNDCDHPWAFGLACQSKGRWHCES